MKAPALARVYVQPGPAGQLQLAVPGVVRVPYRTGVQVSCVPCAAVGRPTLGMPRDGEDAEALCIPCWRAGQERRERLERRGLRAQLWEGLGEAETAAVCAVCGEAEPSQACWLCGYSWLAEARAVYAAEQLVEQAEVDARFEVLAEVSEAEARVADVAGWVQRLQQMVAAYAVGGGRGRGVELLADLLAREAAVRSGRDSLRGRPSVLRYVAAVLAFDADWRSGRRALPGRERTAWLVGCSDRAVYDAWQQVTALRWARRVRVGGRNSLERRIETGRPNDRAEFNLVQLHRSKVPGEARAAMVPVALGVVGELLAHALVVLEQEQAALDALQTRAGGGGVDFAVQVRRTQLRVAVAQTRTTLTGAVPALLSAPRSTANTCRSHSVSKAKFLTSCPYWGLLFFSANKISSVGDRVRPRGGRGNGEGGASRSSTNRARADLGGDGAHRVQRPRTAETVSDTPQARPRPAWAAWAYGLARDLVVLWPWLAGQPLPQVAATLGTRYGPLWSAAEVVDWVMRTRHGRELPVDVHSPLALLRQVSDDALTGPADPPHPARRTAAHRQVQRQTQRDAVAQAATTARAATLAARAAHTAQAAVATTARTAGGGLAAARAAAAAAAHGPATEREAAAARRATLAALTTAPGADEPDEAWP